MTSRLKRGQYHEFDTRLLHSAFDELVDFVEIEQAWMHVVFCDNARKKYKTPWYRTVLRIKLWRSPEVGIAHLEWAASLKIDEEWTDKNNPDFEKPTSQALAAQETIVLYKWWKDERPKRPDPMDASGWSSYCEEKYSRKKNGYSIRDETEEEKKRSHELLNLCHKIEKQQEDEDTEMLIRLVRLRTQLWT
jgi:hypothetical protein